MSNYEMLGYADKDHDLMQRTCTKCGNFDEINRSKGQHWDEEKFKFITQGEGSQLKGFLYCRNNQCLNVGELRYEPQPLTK
jgi:hypothetical protein